MLRENTDVADTIAQQMGGIRALKMMLGATVYALDNGLKFKWPNKERSRGNVCVVTLDPDDTYSMEFFNGTKSVKKFDGLHFPQLVPTFEGHTGWYLTFGRNAKTEARLTEMASPKSRKALHAFLADYLSKPDAAKLKNGLPASADKFANETYGKQSMIYLTWESPEARKVGEKALKDAGFKVNADYWPGSGTSEIQVSYFKGWHWNEAKEGLNMPPEISVLLAEAVTQFEALEERKGSRRLPDGWKMVFGKLRKLFGRQSGYDAKSIGLHGQMKSVAQSSAKLAKRRKPFLSYL